MAILSPERRLAAGGILPPVASPGWSYRILQGRILRAGRGNWQLASCRTGQEMELGAGSCRTGQKGNWQLVPAGFCRTGQERLLAAGSCRTGEERQERYCWLVPAERIRKGNWRLVPAGFCRTAGPLTSSSTIPPPQTWPFWVRSRVCSSW